jgi:two-component system chemotaxis response regulator CheY
VRIVVADDAALLRAAFARIARRLGHEIVAEAADAAALLRLPASVAPDAVVVDGRLPPAGAMAVIASLRQAFPHAAILVVAALGETALLRDAIRAGATGAIARPFQAEGVAAALAPVSAA